MEMSNSHPDPHGSAPSDRGLATDEAARRSPLPGAATSRELARSGAKLGHGLTLAVVLGLFAYGGLWLDARLGTRPWCLLVCVALGFTGSILHLIRVLAPELWPFAPAPKTKSGPPHPG